MALKTTIKIIVDILMTITLLIQMAYHLTGDLAHEWIAVGIIVLFIVHHILNWSWIRNIGKGKYNAIRIFQTGINLLTFLSMTGVIISGIMMSRHVFFFGAVGGGQGFARTLHHISAYWCFVFMSLHIGLHWSMIIGMVRKIAKKAAAKNRGKMTCVVGVLIAAYGAYAFMSRQVPHYMFHQIEYSFFDYSEPVALFFVDYFAIMGLFVFLAYYMVKLIRRYSGGKNKYVER